MNNIPVTFEIYFNDLKPEVQQNMLDTFKLKNEKEANWDVFPLALIDGEILKEE